VEVRWVSYVAVTAAILASSASAADIAPGRLVLRQSDVPVGFKLDRDNSGVRTNAREGEGDPEFRALIARAGRITGYETQFDSRSDAIGSRADVFVTARGASTFLDWFDDVFRREAGGRVDRRRAGIGHESWVWRAPVPPSGSFTFVAWRYGRVFGGVITGLSRERTLALARTQHRRIVTALR